MIRQFFHSLSKRNTLWALAFILLFTITGYQIATARQDTGALRSTDRLGRMQYIVFPQLNPLTYQIEAAAKRSADAVKNQFSAPDLSLIHHNVTTTNFFVGEGADASNLNISNAPSAWDEQWQNHFGGVDSPTSRHGYQPAAFTPKENPFYFALPYNDFANGHRKENALKLCPAHSPVTSTISTCKNRWIKIIANGKTAYAQWEDVGPNGEDDVAYVFDGKLPKSSFNKHAGLDVSPAIRDFMSLDDIAKTDWQFVDASNVPVGPWRQIVTTSQITWQ